MRISSIVFLALCLALIGCNNSAPEAPAPSATPITTSSQKDPAPDLSKDTNLGLIRRSRVLRVGSDASGASEFFTPQAGSSEISELPPGFRSPYRVRGWQSEQEGFAVLSYGDRIVLMLRTINQLDQEDTSDILALYQKEFGTAQLIAGTRAHYYFWEVDGYRVMICDTVRGKKHLLTLSAGTTTAMGQLRMDPQSAVEDASPPEPPAN